MRSIIIALNVIRRTLNGKKGWLFYLVLPAVVVSLFTVMAKQESSDPIDIHLLNADQGVLGEMLIQDMEEMIPIHWIQEKNYASLHMKVTDDADLIGLYIPEDFTERIWNGQTGGLELYQFQVSTSSIVFKAGLQQASALYEQTAAVVRQSGAEQAGGMEQWVSLLREGQHIPIQAEYMDQKPPNSGIYMASGMLLMFLMALMNGSINSILEDRSRNTMSRIYAAPVRVWEIALGNFAGSFIMGSAQIAVILLMTRYILRYDYGISVYEHFLVLECFLLATMGIASAVAGLVRNPKVVSDVQTMIITPTCMLGGCFWPVSIMPDFLQKVSMFMPQRWAIDALEQLSAGKALGDIALHLAILVLTAVVLLGFGASVLKPSDSTS
ncbi:ABC transporter permease [Marinicrinis lubricantis]|uniref:ABC transporter permease n=1 Tax=Marinicrinis lubricantis TaxID=2086470 RepID=A0ABW1IQH7_9BACL